MEMEVLEQAIVGAIAAESSPLDSLIDRLAGAAALLETAAAQFAQQQHALQASRESSLEEQLNEAAATIAALRSARKTQATGTATLLAKEGSVTDSGTLDAALTSLSLEQRIAVKAQLMRSGLFS